MDFSCIDIGFNVISFLGKEKYDSFETANAALENKTGIVDFFEKEDDFVRLQQTLKINQSVMSENRVEYGDFQTNNSPSLFVVVCPKILIEPTCGKGIDAIIGKGNFDIGEFISLKILDLFSKENGYFAFLIKNSVINNTVFEQKTNHYPISNIEKHTI